MATRANWPIFHITPYRKNNSPAGIRAAAKAGRRIDLDAHITKDGRWANIHWARPGREGFRYTAASVAAGVPKWKQGRLVGARVEDLTWAVVRTLRTREGDRIQGMGAALRLAAMLGVDVEVEPKGTPTLAQFKNLARVAVSAYGPLWRRHVLIKRLVLFVGWRTCLKRAKDATFPTMAIRVRYPRSLPKYVDHYRR